MGKDRRYKAREQFHEKRLFCKKHLREDLLVVTSRGL